jgi:hypothetical protein
LAGIRFPLFDAIVTSEYRTVAADRERRIAAAQLGGELAPRGPRPALEDAGKRKVGCA